MIYVTSWRSRLVFGFYVLSVDFYGVGCDCWGLGCAKVSEDIWGNYRGYYMEEYELEVEVGIWVLCVICSFQLG